jgi:hypothetical protein
LPARPSEPVRDRQCQILRDGDPLNGPADLLAEHADRFAVVRLPMRQPIEPFVE